MIGTIAASSQDPEVLRRVILMQWYDLKARKGKSVRFFKAVPYYKNIPFGTYTIECYLFYHEYKIPRYLKSKSK